MAAYGGYPVKQLLLSGAGALAFILGNVPAHAGGPAGGPPTSDPCDLDPDSCNSTDPGTGGGGDGSGGTTGGGGSGTPAGPLPYTFGSGAKLFTLDSLPTGALGTQAFYQPTQDYTSIGLGVLPSSQGGLNQTVGGLTVALSTATYVEGAGAPQTRIRVENDTSNFNYLGVPTGVQVGIEATSFTAAPPGAIYANFTGALSYFSINLYRLSGAFDVNSTITAYSGLDGTGTVLGTAQGTITGGNDFAFTTIELTNLAGARSFAILGGSALANYDDITATAAVPEPATWAIFVGGFGLIGGAMRRRRKRVAFA